MTDFLTRLDFSLAAAGMSQTQASISAGHKGIIANWKQKRQSPTIKSLGEIGSVLDTDPGWLAYGDMPEPANARTGYHATPANRLSGKMEAIADVWAEDGFGLALFMTLERTGLGDSIYLIGLEGEKMRYDHIGRLNAYTLGVDFWRESHGKIIGETDKDPEFAYGTLRDYRIALESGGIARHHCEATSLYSGEPTGWKWDRLIVPHETGLLVVNQVIG